MTQNVLQVPGDAGQPAEDGTAAASTQDARALLDQLHSALGGKAEGDTASPDSQPPLSEQAVREAPSFSKAVARQADQIQYLIEQINRLDNDTQFVELRDVVRDLYGALNDVALRMKQTSSEVAAKIGLLMEAVTIIGGAPDLDAPHDIAAILDGAKAAAARMVSLERLLKEAGAAIVALEENASHGQHTVRDLSAELAKLNAHAESDRNEITGLHQRIGSSDKALAHALISVRETIEADHNEIVRLHQRIESAEQSVAQRLARVGETVEFGRNEVTRLHQQLESADQSLTQGLARVDESVESGRNEIARLHQRIASADQSLSQGLARVDASIESDRNEVTRLHQQLASADQSLAQELARVGETVESGRNEIARLRQRLESAEQSVAQGLARVDASIESGRNEVAQLHQRIASADQSLAQGLARVDESIESGRNEITRLHQRIASTDQASTQGLTTLGERATALRDDLGRMHERLGSVANSTTLHAGFREKIDVLNQRLEETENTTAAEINSWRLQDSERFAALMNRLESLEQKNQILIKNTEHMAARLQAAEQTIATMTQRQKALSTWHDRIAHVLLASPELPAV
jgi:chromosome segregation ATPase